MSKKRNTERMNRNLAITLVVMANSIVWNSLAAFVAAWNKFTGFASNAQTAADNADKQIKGWAVNKRTARRNMAEDAMTIKGAIQAFAKSINDMQLFDAVDFSKSDILYHRSVDALNHCDVIYNEANNNLGSLAPFGVDAGTLANFRVLMQNYQNLISAPINARETRKMFNKQISDWLDKADDTLRNEVAKLMDHFKTSAPNFYQQFFNDLRLVHGATNFTEIIALCRNSDTNQVLPGVLMTITNPSRTYTVTSDYTGVAEKKSMEPGTYQLIFSKAGFQDYIINNFHIGLSDDELVTVSMIPV